ncbi:MAG: MiaB/RimO family radical SAM methylthiotransferase, partial [Candidatus Eisenbacteria bacterium]
GPALFDCAGVDFVVGPDAYSRALPKLIKREAPGLRVVEISRDPGFRFPASDGHAVSSLRAFVSIMKGCSNRCSFCIVPQVRGPAVSRPRSEVLGEVAALVRRGVREITLIGQNVNAYRDGGRDFAQLLSDVSDGGPDARVRFTTSHPRDMSPSVIKVMVSKENVCEHIHLPLQSGSDRVLERMRRGYTRERYEEIAGAARESVPGVSITTDLIVGFPGETLDDFEQTCEFVERIGFDSSFMFKFSPRAGTEAAGMDDDVPREEKERRLAALLNIQRQVSSERSAALVGSRMEVLVEGEKKKGGRVFLSGRTRCNRTVLVDGPRERIGEFARVEITVSKGLSLFARVASTPSDR